jgi:predicted metal-dependent peptidase
MLTSKGIDERALQYLQSGRYKLIDPACAPFFGYGAMKLGLVEDLKIPTLCTDGQVIRYNPKYVTELSGPSWNAPDESLPAIAYTTSEMCHESMHAILGHCQDWKAQGYDPILANDAQDYVINLMLAKMGLPVHKNWLYDERFKGMTWHEVYKILNEEKKKGKPQKHTPCQVLPQPSPTPDKEEEKSDGEGEGEAGEIKVAGQSGGGKGDGKEPEKSEKKPSRNNWDQIAVEAAKYAEGVGNCPADAKEYVREILKPIYDWKSALARYLSKAKKGSYSYRRLNKRYLIHQLALPSLHSYTADAVCAIDRSGSTFSMVPSFLGHIARISGALGVPIEVAEFDTKVANVFTLKRVDDLSKLTRELGGGTDFNSFFEWMSTRRKPEVAVIFTDGYGPYPETPPSFKVLWCIPNAKSLKGGEYYPPFGVVLDIPIADLK